MKAQDKKAITIDEASKEVELTSRRLGLLHLAYAKTLVTELGDEKGREMVLKAIKYYGQLVGEKMRRDVEGQELAPTPENYGSGVARTLPKFGMHEGGEAVEVDGSTRMRAYGCAMAKVWREYGEEDLGSLYCYVDPAKYMYYNPEYKMVHRKAMPVTGGDCCEFEVLPTTKKEREDFFSKDRDWSHVDGVLGRNRK